MKNGWRSAGVAAAFLVMLTVAAYFPALQGGFIWDDDDHLTKNPAMLSVEGLRQIWSSLPISRYYPLTLTSFWAQRRLWGLDPLPYHAVNIGLQAVNAVLLWTLLRRLQIRGAWVVAAVWALHPVNVETVAWVTELKNTQSGVFFLLALVMLLRFEDELRPRDYVIALACGAAAMLSKPSTVVLPGVVLLCAWWRRGSWTRKDLLRTAPLAALAVGMSLLTIVEQRKHIEIGGASEWTLTVAQRLVLAGRAVWFYAGKLLWPMDVCFIYPRWELRADSIAAWLPLAGLALVAGVLWQFRRAGWARAATFGLGCFIVALLPVVGFFDVYFFRYSYVADHFQYLASIGFIALAVSAGGAILRWARPQSRASLTLAGTIVLLALGASTWRQTHAYRDLETLWRDTVAKNPNSWMVQNSLGSSLAQVGKLDEAKEHLEQALYLKPDLPDIYNDLGIVLMRMGKLDEAVWRYEQALHLRPNFDKAHNNLGEALMGLGRTQEAITHYEQALRVSPDYALAHSNLGATLQQAGRIQEAIGHYERALQIQPRYVDAWYNLGIALGRAGRIQEAIECYEHALRIKPDFVDARYNLGIALEQAGRERDAIECYEQILRINPNHAEAHNNLGSALALAGKMPEAIRHWEEALRIRPDFPEAHNNLGAVFMERGQLKEAVNHFEQALQINPGYAKAHYNLGVASELSGRMTEAVEHYKRALQIKPEFVEAQSRLARLREVQ